jgi:hypothetical protein
MPIVFVHGVNNREEDAGYASGVERTRTYLREVFAPRLNPPPKDVQVSFPYWGNLGVTFRWNQASLPNESDEVEALSVGAAAGPSAESRLWAGDLYRSYNGKPNFADIALDKGLEEAIDLIWDTASQSGGAGSPEDLAKSYQRAQAYLAKYPAPGWAMKRQSNEDFLTALQANLDATAPAEGAPREEAFAAGDWFDDFKESVSRLVNSSSDNVTALALALWRKKVHTGASRFLGDIFVYLTRRGDMEAPGPIVKQLAKALDDAAALKRDDDPELIVIAHSLGGVIVYDLLTHHRPDIKVDRLITVGSQVGVFEEMTLYKSSKEDRPPDPATQRLDKPENVTRWLNVYDTNDVFSFRIEGVFQGARDYRFDTGFGVSEAHGGYFARPSFYKRLAARVS